MEIKKGDFITLDYTGKTTDGHIFDTTKADIAKDQGLPERKYKSVTVCVGENHVIKGLDNDLVGKETGKQYAITVKPEEAFGKKDAKLIQLIAENKFKKAKMNPQVGMEVTIDNNTGIIRKTGGGRVLVDFNHPLSGIDVVYEYEIKGVVTDTKEKLDALLEILRFKFPKTVVDKEKAVLTAPVDVPQELQSLITTAIQRSIPELKVIEYAKEEKKPEEKSEKKEK